MATYYYVPVKYTVTETFKFGGIDFGRTSITPSPDLDYYSLVGGIYESENREKYDELREAGIFNTVVYDPVVCSTFVSFDNHDTTLRFEHTHDIFGGRLVKENEPTTNYRENLGCIYHKVTQTIHSTNENEYESIFIDYDDYYDGSDITETVGYGTHETVLYDSRSAKVDRGPYFIYVEYYPLKNGVKNVGSADPFTVTVTTTHEIIHPVLSTKYESVMAALSASGYASLAWLIDDDIPYIDGVPKTIESIPDPNSAWVTVNQWDEKTWSGLSSHDGIDMWSDGTNFYYSNGYNQYVLDKTTETWSPKTWTGLTSFNGRYIWTDGINIYYSNGNTQYVLDPSTSTWSSKSWTGLRNFYGSYVWKSETGGIYYSNASDQYVLNKSENKWVKKTWSGVSQPGGIYIWTDGVNTYYSKTTAQYVLNPSTSTWSVKRWTGLTNFYGQYIWSNGDDIYYSKGSEQYVLDKETYTWIPKTWLGLTAFNGQYVWTYDDNNMYYSYGSDQYELHYRIPYRLSYLDMNESENVGGKWMINDDIPYRRDFPEQKESLNYSDLWLIDNDIPYRYEYPELKESFNVGGEWLTKDEPDTSSTKKYLKFTHTVTATFTAGNRAPTVSYDFTDSEYYTTPRYYDQGVSSWSNIYGRIFVPANAKVRKDEWDLSNTDIYGIMNPSGPNYFKKLDGYSETIDPTSDKLHYDSGDYYWAYPSRDYGTNKYYIEFSLAMLRQLTPSESGSTTITFSHIFEFDSENEDYRAFLEAYPNNVEPWYPMRKAVPYRLDFPAFNSSIPGSDIWLIDDEYPYRVDFPLLYESSGGATSWLQDKGWDPRRPWPEHRSIIQKVQTIPNIPDVDWTKSMQQTFEFYTVDPNNWYDDQKLENIISCDITHDLTSDKRGNASITVSESLPECYIRTYLVVTQAGYMHKICLGTYLYMTSSDSFDGMKHNITMTGYTPMVELEEKLPPLGFHIVGITNRKHSSDAPMVTDAIKDIVTTYTRCEIENRTVIQKPLLNDFVAGTNDNFLTVINNILNASSLQQYILTVDEWGTIIVKDKPVLEDAIPTYIYTDDNSSILLPSLDTNDDIYGIPNVVEVLYTGDKRLPAIRVIVKNEDPTSIVSIPARGREIAKRFTITNIAAPVNDYSEAAVRAQVTAQAERLLEAASTINKTISYSHGYCDVKVGDTVLINYERAGVTGIRAKVVSQRISCKPGCQVDEQAVYTKKLWNRGV